MKINKNHNHRSKHMMCINSPPQHQKQGQNFRPVNKKYGKAWDKINY